MNSWYNDLFSGQGIYITGGVLVLLAVFFGLLSALAGTEKAKASDPHSFYGVDGEYHPAGQYYGFDGKYHAPNQMYYPGINAKGERVDYRPNNEVYGIEDGRWHNAGSHLDIDGKRHEANSTIGVDGEYHHVDSIYGVDGLYHDPPKK